MIDKINSVMGPGTAEALDATSIRVSAPRDTSQRVSYLSIIENMEIETGIERAKVVIRSEEHTSELQSRPHLVCRLLLEKKKGHLLRASSAMGAATQKHATSATASGRRRIAPPHRPSDRSPHLPTGTRSARATSVCRDAL